MFALIGDGDYRRDVLELPSLTSNTPCGRCCANVTTHKWFDFTDTAAWHNTTLTATQWWKSSLCTCKLFAKEIHVSILNVFGDWMHDKNSGTDKVSGPPDVRTFCASVASRYVLADRCLWSTQVCVQDASYSVCEKIGLPIVVWQRCCMAARCISWCTMF